MPRPTSTPTPRATPTPAAVTIPIGRSIDVQMYDSVIRWEVISLTDPYTREQPWRSAHRYIVLYVRATNIGNQTERLFCADTCTRVVLSDGEASNGIRLGLDRPFEETIDKFGGFDLLPGRSVEGEICYSIPREAQVLGFRPNWIRGTPALLW
ncbi:hypothetical protein [Tepidiforma sp.]|uniref:hypothetical protein n=1 Tax=Tepidiforma sp. TaxID=2682230 RepID=UPI002ADDDE75|nr:hypothetical protein [Tepidiforma sp.]